MNVYLLDTDTDNYQWFAPKNKDGWSLIDSLGDTSVPNLWAKVEMNLSGRKLLIGDFPYLASDIPVFSQRAIDTLNDLLVPNGELLPLVCPGYSYSAFNVTSILDVLDEDLSDIIYFNSSKKVMDIEKYMFRPEKLTGAVIFKIPQFYRSYVFVTDIFVKRVQEAGLTGFKFPLLWSDEPPQTTVEKDES